MVMKSLAKKAKALFKGKRREEPEVVQTPPQNLQAPPQGNPGGGAIPLHGWKGATPGKEKGDGPKIGGNRATFKAGVKPGGEKGPLVIGKRDAPKVTWKKGEKGEATGGGLKIGGDRGKGGTTPLPVGGGYLNHTLDQKGDEKTPPPGGGYLNHTLKEKGGYGKPGGGYLNHTLDQKGGGYGKPILPFVGGYQNHTLDGGQGYAATHDLRHIGKEDNSDVGSDESNGSGQVGSDVEVGSSPYLVKNLDNSDSANLIISGSGPREELNFDTDASEEVPVPKDNGIFQHSNPEELGPEFVEDGPQALVGQVLAAKVLKANSPESSNVSDENPALKYLAKNEQGSGVLDGSDIANKYLGNNEQGSDVLNGSDIANKYLGNNETSDVLGGSDIANKYLGNNEQGSNVLSGSEVQDVSEVANTPANKYLRENEEENSKAKKYLGATNYKSDDGNFSHVYSKPISDSLSTFSTGKEERKQQAIAPIVRAPNVQPITPEHKDEKVAKLQKALRDNSTQNKDVDEKHGNRVRQVIRGQLSTTEKRSAGWANLAMREDHRNHRDQYGRIVTGDDNDLLGNGQATQYFVTKAMRLDEEARTVLSNNLKAGGGQKREDSILKCVDGKFKNAKDELVDSSDIPALNQAIWEMKGKLAGKMENDKLKGLDQKLTKHQEQLKNLMAGKTQQETARKMGIAGRLIFVMNSAGEFFAGKSLPGVIHHSSFLAGGAVSGAGEIAISGGQVTAISNTSGHYRPGPAYLWQAVKQLELLGVNLDNVRVDVMGVSKPFKSAREFLGAFDPSSDPSMFDAGLAIAHLNKYLEEKSKSKKLEDKVMERSEEVAQDGQTKPPQGN